MISQEIKFQVGGGILFRSHLPVMGNSERSVIAMSGALRLRPWLVVGCSGWMVRAVLPQLMIHCSHLSVMVFPQMR